MDHGPSGLVEYLNQWVGGAFTALLAAIAGRLMFHTQEVRSKRRKPFGWELLWEIPSAIALGFIGNGIASYFTLGQDERVGVISLVAYAGPKVVNHFVQKYLGKKLESE